MLVKYDSQMPLNCAMSGACQMISNGRFRSVQHRVFPTQAPAGRLSIATFNKPTPDTIVQPAPELCSKTQPPLYRPVKFLDCQIEFFARKNLGPGFIKRYEMNSTDIIP